MGSVELVQQQPGFLARDSAGGANGIDIVISYWKDEESIWHWKQQIDHLKPQKLGQQRWMKNYQVRIGRLNERTAMTEQAKRQFEVQGSSFSPFCRGVVPSSPAQLGT